MTTIGTDLRVTVESARRIRYESGSGILATNVQDAIEEVATSPPSVSPTDVNFALSPYAVTTSDTVLWVDTSGGAVTITLPTGAARAGKSLEIKDISGNASTNNISIDPAPGETIDGLDPLLINIDFGGWKLYPKPANGWTTQA